MCDRRIIRERMERIRKMPEEYAIVPNSSVREAIGVKGMLLYTSGDLSADDAEEKVAARALRLVRRQILC